MTWEVGQVVSLGANPQKDNSGTRLMMWGIRREKAKREQVTNIHTFKKNVGRASCLSHQGTQSWGIYLTNAIP